MRRPTCGRRCQQSVRGSVCILCAASLAGCLAFAVPTREHTPKAFPTRGMIKDDSLAFIETGSTYRQDVLLRLGEPDVVSADETMLVYRWRTVHGIWRVAAVATEARGEPLNESGYINEDRYDLVLEFDDRGLVARYGSLDDWGRSVSSDTADPVVSTLELSVVHQRASGHYRASTLRLGGGVVEFAPVHTKTWEEADHSFTLPLDTVVSLSRSKESENQWTLGRLSYTIGFSDETPSGDEVRLLVDLLDVPSLIAFLRRNCPNIGPTT